MGHVTRRVVLVLFVTFAVLGLSRPSAAVPIGVFSFDTYIAGPGGTSAFNLSNFTGSNALLPDFPVIDDVVLQNVVLNLHFADGTHSGPLSVGDLAPGFLLDGLGAPLGSLQFPDITGFFSADLSATLSLTTFMLSGGSVFTAYSSLVNVSLLPQAGTTLQAGLDLVVLDVDGAVAPAMTEVPEPATLALVLTGGVAGWARRRRRRS